MSKQYFYSFYMYDNGIEVSFGHGSTTVDDDSRSAYENTIKDIKELVDNDSLVIHLTAFNRID